MKSVQGDGKLFARCLDFNNHASALVSRSMELGLVQVEVCRRWFGKIWVDGLNLYNTATMMA